MTTINKISQSKTKLLLIASGVLISALIISFVQSASFEVTNQPEPTVSGTSVVPGAQDRGSSVVITSTVTDVSGVIYVKVQIKNGAGVTVANIDLFDDGAHNDGAAGDDVYGNTWAIPVTLAIGNYKIFITASDTLGNVYQTGVTIPFGDAGPRTEEANFNVTTPAATCPDGTCDVAGGECSTCAADCAVADCCGFDPLCNAGVGENNGNCAGDCPAGCVSDGCNGVCPAGCAPAGDPDCPAGGCCGDGNCDAGEDCSTCADCSCTAPQICCAGTCQNPTCSGVADCNDGSACTTDTCNNAGTCTASCSNTAIVACTDGDGCCPAGCDGTTDNDCCTLLTCTDYPGQCGVALNDGCSSTIDCSGACTAPQICCAGTCQNQTCINNSDCDDGDSCTADTCNNAGTCTASCSNTAIVACTDGDGCCPAGCNAATDNDCSVVLPASFDWSHKELPGADPAGGADWMSPVRNQGSCGSCWAFSAVGSVEGQYNIEQNNPALDVNLSERYLVSTCCSAGSCSGGWPDWALKHIRDNGFTGETCFPYAASDCNCNLRCATWSSDLWKIGSYVNEWTTTQDEMKSLIVNHGPLSGYIEMTGSSGIPDHAIVIVGYDDAASQWIVRNSWGAGYSGNGYWKVGYGQKAIESWGFCYPMGVTSP